MLDRQPPIRSDRRMPSARTAAHGGGGPAVDTVLRLQRTAGNRATTRWLQRRLTTTADHLEPPLPGEHLRGLTRRDDWSMIRQTLREYHAAPTQGGQRMLLSVLLTYIERWLGRNGTDAALAKRTNQLHALRLEIRHEVEDLDRAAEGRAGERDYLASIDEDRLRFLSSTGGMARERAAAVYGGDSSAGDFRAHADLYGVGEAGSTALGMFTADEFKYTNPAMAGDAEWLKASLKKLIKVPTLGSGEVAEDLAMEEGRIHGARMKEAVRNLPAWQSDDGRNVTFRGESLTPEKVEEKYPVGTEVEYGQFQSNSKDRATAEGFMRSALADPRNVGHVGVFVFIHLTQGRDIMPFSMVPTEGEVLASSGTRFYVRSVQPRPNNPNIIEVKLDQVGWARGHGREENRGRRRLSSGSPSSGMSSSSSASSAPSKSHKRH